VPKRQDSAWLRVRPVAISCKGAGSAQPDELGSELTRLPILYGVWHTQGGSGGGRTLRISRAIAL